MTPAVDAMILAAGLGTRLRPLTDRVPKALVEVNGVPMLERVARRLIDAGTDRLVINIHHHAEAIRAFVASRGDFGIDVRFSPEPEPLETGGGVVAARRHFREDGPFFIHNVDVICDADLATLYRDHQATGTLATLAVQDRPSSRMLRFDDAGLQARVDHRDGTEDVARPPAGQGREWAFSGIHVVSPELFDLVTEAGAFSIIEPYLRLAGEGRRILPYDITGAEWLEIGDPDRLEKARRVMRDREAGGGGR